MYFDAAALRVNCQKNPHSRNWPITQELNALWVQKQNRYPGSDRPHRAQSAENSHILFGVPLFRLTGGNCPRYGRAF